jgi:hypothetical protein
MGMHRSEIEGDDGKLRREVEYFVLTGRSF